MATPEQMKETYEKYFANVHRMGYWKGWRLGFARGALLALVLTLVIAELMGAR